MKGTLKEEFLNLPNMLTLGRIAAIPFVMLLIWKGSPAHCVAAAWVYAAATLTDFFDGWLARRRGLVTVMGKFLDPLADKLLVMAMLFMLVYLHRLPAWIAVVILSREMVINGLRAIASSEGLIIPAGRGGKLKTALQMLGVQCLLLHYTYPVYFYGVWKMDVDFAFVGLWILLLSVVFSITSAVEYFQLFFRALDEQRAAA